MSQRDNMRRKEWRRLDNLRIENEKKLKEKDKKIDDLNTEVQALNVPQIQPETAGTIDQTDGGTGQPA